MTFWHFSSLLKGRKMQVVMISDWPGSQLEAHYSEMKERLAYQAQVVSSTGQDYEVVEFIKVLGLAVDVASTSATACRVCEIGHLWTQHMLQKCYI